MAKPDKTLAVVMRRSDFRESSRVVTLLTRKYGMRGFLAKGAHRPGSPFLGAIDLLHLVEARVQVSEGRGLQNLYSARLLLGNRPFRHDRKRRLLAYSLAEILRIAMPEGRVDPRLFDLFQGGLQLLARAEERRLGAIHVGLGLKILDHLGLLPSLAGCPVTGRAFPRRGEVGFDPVQGGFVDADEARRRVSSELPALAEHLRDLTGRDLGLADLPVALLARLQPTISELLVYHLDFEPRIQLPAQLFIEPALATEKSEPRIKP